MIFESEVITVREWLKELRGKRTQRDVARSAGIVESYYSMIETGVRQPPVDKAKNIANALNFDWQLFYDDENTSRHDPPQNQSTDTA